MFRIGALARAEKAALRSGCRDRLGVGGPGRGGGAFPALETRTADTASGLEGVDGAEGERGVVGVEGAGEDGVDVDGAEGAGVEGGFGFGGVVCGIGDAGGELDFAAHLGGEPEGDGVGVVGIEAECGFGVAEGHDVGPDDGGDGEGLNVVKALVPDPDGVGFFIGEERLVGGFAVVVVVGGLQVEGGGGGTGGGVGLVDAGDGLIDGVLEFAGGVGIGLKFTELGEGLGVAGFADDFDFEE